MNDGDTTDAWESAYLRFETPEQETRKFENRLRKLGASRWPRDARVVELFCGRGSGLTALERLGFIHLEGVDISARLVSQYRGRAYCEIADCRALPFKDASRDILLVQGGLHHLTNVPSDVERVLADAYRALRPGGQIVLVEPWLTPFLRVAHAATGVSALRRVWPKLDALATMIDHERDTYEQWLREPAVIRDAVHKSFNVEREMVRLGKWYCVARKRA